MNEKLKIMIVEDEAIIAMALRSELEDQGFTICASVASGEDAIYQARLHEPALIIMDIHLAGNIDGIETAFAIRQFIPAGIIFMTGYAGDIFRNRAAKLEPLGYFVKPISFYNLKPLLDQLPKIIVPPAALPHGSGNTTQFQ